MNRLIRIALTLFASASVLIFLVLKRLEGARKLVGEAQASEVQMAYLGMGVAAVMLVIGVAFVITAIIRARKGKNGPANDG
jgi:hypothetical protein